jgi:hypothetical protein
MAALPVPTNFPRVATPAFKPLVRDTIVMPLLSHPLAALAPRAHAPPRQHEFVATTVILA